MGSRASTSTAWEWSRPVAYDRRSARVLTAAATFFAVSVVAHTADHLRRGLDSITTELLGAGWVGLGISALAILLVALRHDRAPQVAIIAGIVLPVGFVAAHWLPTWSVFSDSFVEGEASVLSQAASLFEIVGALCLGAAGLHTLRRARPRSSRDAGRVT